MDSDLHMQPYLLNRLPVINDGIPPQLFSESLFQSTLCQLNNQDDSIIGLPIFQEEPLKDLHADRNGNLNIHEHCLASTTLDPDSSECLREMFSSSSIPTSIYCGYDDVIVGDVNGKWDENRFLTMQPELSWRTSTPGLQPLQIRPCLDCSSHGNKELSLLGFASNSSPPPQFSEIIVGSRYLGVLKQILSEIASFSLPSIDQANFSDGLVSSSSKLVFSSNHLDDPGISFKHTSEFCDDDGSFDPPENSYRRQDVELKKSQLLALLQVVDDCYNRCLDEVHTVISAFHAATELDPQVHACFPLQTISFFYKNLRERISNEILAIGMNSGRSLEKCFIRKQWALQLLKRKDQQLWRPQRGLPERSVSVLRAWMFDNFLHPYPKDTEKHLLAIKSGLTRSQVSNWFINARVRLWKPLVEEMCAEMNRRKGSRQNDEVTKNSDNHRSQLSIYDHSQRYSTPE